MINQLMLDHQGRFYFDLMPDGKRVPAMARAAVWTLLAGAASPDQARALHQGACRSETALVADGC
jgi:hypothetical protein